MQNQRKNQNNFEKEIKTLTRFPFVSDKKPVFE